ncbi:hypothetical protein OQA88_5108 [Cercophora sp. LCS_1]
MAITRTRDESFSKVAEKAISALCDVKQARHELHGAQEPLEGIVKEANRMTDLINVAKSTEALQTPGIAPHVAHITELMVRLFSSMMIMGAENRRLLEPRVLLPEHHEYGHLSRMCLQLAEARSGLEDLVLAGRVALRGNAREGYVVVRDSLRDANDKVRSALGVDLLLYKHLKARMEAGGDNIIRLTDAEIERLGLPRVSGPRVEQWRAVVGVETGIVRTA